MNDNKATVTANGDECCHCLLTLSLCYILSPTLTNFIPQLSALVSDWNALRAPQRQPRVCQKLFRD